MLRKRRQKNARGPEALAERRRLFGSRLLKLRQRLGWTQRELGRRTGLRGERLSRLEHGDSSPRLEEIVVLREALGVSFDQLMPGGELEGVDLAGASEQPQGSTRWVARCLIAAGQTLLEAHELEQPEKAEAAL